MSSPNKKPDRQRPRNVSSEHRKYALIWFEEGCRSLQRIGDVYDMHDAEDCKRLSAVLSDRFAVLWDRYVEYMRGDTVVVEDEGGNLSSVPKPKTESN